MRAGFASAGVLAVLLVAVLAGGASADSICDTPAPNPTNTSAGIGVQIGTPAADRVRCETSEPTASPSEAPVKPPGGVKKPPRKPGKPTHQAAPAGAPGAPVPPSKPTDGAEPLVLNPARVEAGGLVSASASGYTPGEQVQLVLYPSPTIIGSYLVDGNGGIAFTFTVPIDTPSGPHTAEVTGWDSDRVTNGALVVTGSSVAVAGISTKWWLIGIIIALGLALIALIISYRSSIAAFFARNTDREATQ